ncbi:hypothetical protein KFK09_022982 [Dendrobium nobile]|uniref:Uncharacterized protein n=1 Tax=Dendrobium nobile TaxID=94219 RepID=A0A8T3AKM4_DENNO|nr:hypothetical protein KFK09_022982 [Dendrobium nobile]
MVRCLPTTASGAAAGEITSVYATRLGTITLRWSRASLGIYLRADLRLTPSTSPSPSPDNDNAVADHLRLRLRPYLTWKRKGSKLHQFTSGTGSRRVVELAWDLSLATFSRGRGPEPTGGFFVSFSVDGEIALIVGDRGEEGICEKGSELISRRERVRFGGLGGEMSYATKGKFEGKEMAISISIDLEGEDMRLGIDGEIVLEVTRLCWKFRGSEAVALKSGGRIHVSWDLHDWLFQQEAGWERSPAAVGEAGEAVFVLRFERGVGGEGQIGKGGRRAFWEGRWCFWKRDWSDSSSGSSSGSSVEELGCCESELQSSGEGGFTLLVYGRKG